MVLSSAPLAINLLPQTTTQVTSNITQQDLSRDHHVIVGGRGALREVWRDTTSLNTIQDRPRAVNTSIQERLFRISTLSAPEFGEEVDFAQRFSGFFVPPKSSLYTFNLRSDDLSRFFLSPNASSQYAERILELGRHTSKR